MKREDIYNGISGINAEYIKEAAGSTRSRRIALKRLIAAAACLCLIAAFAAVRITSGRPVTVFTVTAYASEADGASVRHAMEPNDRVKLAYAGTEGSAEGYCLDLSQEGMSADDYLVSLAITDENGAALPVNEEALGPDGEKCLWSLELGRDISVIHDDMSPEVLELYKSGQLTPVKSGRYLRWLPDGEDSCYVRITYYHTDFTPAAAYLMRMTREEDGCYAAVLEVSSSPIPAA